MHMSLESFHNVITFSQIILLLLLSLVAIIHLSRLHKALPPIIQEIVNHFPPIYISKISRILPNSIPVAPPIFTKIKESTMKYQTIAY